MIKAVGNDGLFLCVLTNRSLNRLILSVLKELYAKRYSNIRHH